jgi:hypothetical protein
MKMFMVGVFVILALYSFGNSSPNADMTTRAVFLGHDDEHYYYISVESNGLGSYYSIQEMAYLYKYRFDGSDYERIMLYGARLDHVEGEMSHVWESKPLERDTEKIAEYFVNNHIRCPVTTHLYDIRKIKVPYEFVFKNDGLFIEYNDEREMILSSAKIDSCMHIKIMTLWGENYKQPTFPEWFRGSKKNLDLYICNDYLIVHVLSRGFESIGGVLSVSFDALRGAEQLLNEKFEER